MARRSGTCVKLARASSFHSKSRAVDLISKATVRKIHGMIRSLYRNKSHTRVKSTKMLMKAEGYVFWFFSDWK